MKEYKLGILSYSSSYIDLVKRSQQRRLIFVYSGVSLVVFQGDVKIKNAFHQRKSVLCPKLD